MYEVALTLTRRNFLASGTLAIQGGLLSTKAAFPQELSRYAIVVLSGASTLRNEALLVEICSVFFAQRIPICCVIDPFILADRGGLRGSDLGKNLVDINRTAPGLFEVALRVDKTTDPERFFQMRTAAEIRASIANDASSQHEIALVQNCTSVFLDQVDAAFELSAYRGAGFRIFLMPNSENPSGAVDSRFVGRDQLLAQGRYQINPGKDVAEQLQQQRIAGASSLETILQLDLSVLEKYPIERATQVASDVARELVNRKRRGQSLPVRPIELLTQSGGPVASNFVIVMDKAALDADPQIPAFIETLQQAGIPIHPLSKSKLSKLDEVKLTLPQEQLIGLNAEAHYQIPFAEEGSLTEKLAKLSGPLDDLVIQLTNEDLSTFVVRARTRQILTDLKQTGAARFHDLPAFVEYLFSPDFVLQNFQSMRRRFRTMPSSKPQYGQPEQDLLRVDAQLAWAFIEKYSHSRTGLCAGTVRGGSDRRINRNATLWDVASQMLGIQSALALKIIPRSEATDRLNLVLQNLPAAPIAGGTLPPAVFSTSTKRADSLEFDVCDTGRFLNALNRLVANGLVSQSQFDEVLAFWTLPEAFRDQRAFNFTRGRWVDSTLSFCTPYAQSGFSTLGEQVIDPIKAVSTSDKLSRDIKVMYQAAKLGHLGTEPLLLSPVEGEKVEEFEVLSRVLFDAQLRWYEQTGNLKCVSETLLDFEPWFSYQGYRIDKKPSEAWIVATPDRSGRFKSPKFIERAEVISSKAAFLWLAAYPHAHSQRLVNFIREKARFPGLGFAAGVYAQTQKPMAHYSDVNTNGIILTAIAHALKNAA